MPTTPETLAVQAQLEAQAAAVTDAQTRLRKPANLKSRGR